MMTQLLQVMAAGCGKPTFLGLVPWYEYLQVGKITVGDSSYCGVTHFSLLGSGGSDLPLILLAIVDDLLRVAGLAAVIFVIYGGVRYATSQGNPDATSKAQSTIINALVGLVIAMIAVATVSFIGNKLTS